MDERNDVDSAAPLFAPDRHAWVQIASGGVHVGGHDLATGDGLQVSDETELAFRAQVETDLLLFDLA